MKKWDKAESNFNNGYTFYLNIVKDKDNSCLIGIFLTALIVPAFLPGHFFGKK